MLQKRVITALWGLPLTAIVIWFGEPYFTIILIIVGILAIVEFNRIANIIKRTPLSLIAIVWTVLLIAVRNSHIQSFIDPYIKFELLIPLIITAGIVLSLITLLARKEKQGSFNDWAWMFAGILYVGWLSGYLVALRGLSDGREWVFLALFASFGSDSAAFFIGRSFGKHKAAPEISPKKTIEGCIAGLGGGVIVTLLFLLPTPLGLSAYLNWWEAVILGVLVSGFGQLGDLVESLFKRNVGVKDSGNLFPGHGGILDRMDSIVFAVVVVYYWAIWAIH